MSKDLYQQFLDEVNAGIEGKSVWVPLSYDKMGKHIIIEKRNYTILGGPAGSGKTAFTDQTYLIDPFLWMIKNLNNTDIRMNWIYRSMERSSVQKIAKWTAMILYRKYKVLVDSRLILNKGQIKNRISSELYELILDSGKIVEQMFDYVELVDGQINPTGIYKHVKQHALARGREEETIEIVEGGKQLKRRRYIPNNENLINIVIEDHLGRLSGERVEGKYHHPESKELLDKMSVYNSSEFRDYYGYSPVAVIQFNRGLEDTMRRVKTELGPLPSDFKGSSNMYADCDTALGLYNPYKLGDMDHAGYDIPEFVADNGENRFRSVTILKNSFGVDDLVCGFNFIGEIGYMKELPTSTEINNYERYRNPVNENHNYLT